MKSENLRELKPFKTYTKLGLQKNKLFMFFNGFGLQI